MNLRFPGFHPSLENVTVNDGFWTPLLKKFREVTLPDVIKKFTDEKCNVLSNFSNIYEGKNTHVGQPWSDGLFYEVITAAADFLAVKRDCELEKQLDAFAVIIEKAQLAGGDGYIATFTSSVAPKNRFGTHGGNALAQHDLYNIGCLIEAGVHYYKATGKTRLLVCAIRAVDYLCGTVGLPPMLDIVPGHSMIEVTLAELCELFGTTDAAEKLKEITGKAPDEAAYLKLLEFFIDRRGHHSTRSNCPAYLGEYAQDHTPVIYQREAVGHAVRAMLLYSGITAAARITGREELYEASLGLWENVSDTKLHISGGVGAMAFQENFGTQYQLPENAYLETCAGSALMRWIGELSVIENDSEYIDVFERVLYNNLLSGVSEDGTKYFYQNPLRSDGTIQRWEWHDCPCCPPMFLKAVSSLGRYIYTLFDGGIRVDMFIGSTLTLSDITLTQNGKGNIAFALKGKKHLKLMLRRPEYQTDISYTLNGERIYPETENGYSVIERDFADGDTVTVKYNEPPIAIIAHPYSDEVCYRTAYQRGAMLMCAEGCDNGGRADITVAAETKPIPDGDGLLMKDIEGNDVKLVPYYRWCNREIGKMAVWFPTVNFVYDKFNLDGWEGKLYRLTPME